MPVPVADQTPAGGGRACRWAADGPTVRFTPCRRRRLSCRQRQRAPRALWRKPAVEAPGLVVIGRGQPTEALPVRASAAGRASLGHSPVASLKPGDRVAERVVETPSGRRSIALSRACTFAGSSSRNPRTPSLTTHRDRRLGGRRNQESSVMPYGRGSTCSARTARRRPRAHARRVRCPPRHEPFRVAPPGRPGCDPLSNTSPTPTWPVRRHISASQPIPRSSSRRAASLPAPGRRGDPR